MGLVSIYFCSRCAAIRDLCTKSETDDNSVVRYCRRPICVFALHWLPVSYWTEFKLCCLIHAIRYDRSPKYLWRTLYSQPADSIRSGLRSSSRSTLACWVVESTRGPPTTLTLYLMTILYCHHGYASILASEHSHILVRPHMDRSARQNTSCDWSCSFHKTVEITLFCKGLAFNV